MEKLLALTLVVAACATFNASAQSSYTTTNGEVNLLAGLTSLTSATAINTTNQSVGIDYITDASWSTGIANLGTSDQLTPNNGTLAGTFGGGTYFASLNNIILIGGGVAIPAWGGWTLRLLLSNDTYSSAVSYTNSDLVINSAVTTVTNSVFFQSSSGATNFAPGAIPTYYQMLDISTFDTSDIGVKGIELSSMSSPYPDITYIGVTGIIPEPSTYALLVLAAAGLGGYVLRRSRR